MGSYPSGQRGLTVNQLSDDFRGSNPLLPTCAGNQHTAEDFFGIPRGSSPAARQALIAQMAEHVLGKNGVMGSIPIEGSVADLNVGLIFIN